MFVESSMQNIEYLKYPFRFENPEWGGGSRSENKTLRGITALAAFCVVIIHCNVPGMFGDVVTGLSRFAVPYFFMISGYYLFSKNGYLEKIPNKIWNTVKLILILKVMYLIIDLILLKNGTIGMNEVAYNFVISSDYNQHVWFLYALLALYIFSYIAAKHNFDISRLFGAAIVVLVIDLIFSEILPICGFNTVQISNKIYPFIGLSFFIIGYLIHKNIKYIKSLLTNRLLAISVMGGGGLSVIESIFVDRTNLYFGIIVFTVSLFLLAIKNPNKIKSRTLTYVGRELSGGIYIIHPAIILIFDLMQTKIEGFEYIEPVFVYVISVIMMFCFSIGMKIVRNMQNRRAIIKPT